MPLIDIGERIALEKMKKPDEKNKKKMREKNQLPSETQIGTANGQSSQVLREDRNRGVQTIPKKKEAKGKISSYIGIAGQFLRESRTELKKVKWPTKKELLASTAAVLVLVLVISLYLGLIDFGLIKLIKSIVG